jgi:ParB-like chromosome segregation protein Spo0J
MQIIKKSIAELSNDPANARKHDDRNIESIVASLRRFGQQKPIVIDMNNIVRAGNGTLEAARRLGWDSIECVKTNLKGSDAIAYAIADNRTSELAEWDSEVLAAQLNGLLVDDEELANAAGFTAEEIEAMLENSVEKDSDFNSPEITISPELHERQDYLVIVFDNELDWLVATQLLKVETKKASKVETSTIEKTGVGRVITGQDFLKVIND